MKAWESSYQETGVSGLIKGDMVKEGAVVIDIGKCTHQWAQQQWITKLSIIECSKRKTNVVAQAVHNLKSEVITMLCMMHKMLLIVQ